MREATGPVERLARAKRAETAAWLRCAAATALGAGTTGFARFARWLRSNSEHYLLIDAQTRVAARHGARRPSPPSGLRDRFWRQVFAPAYRRIPWRLRKRLIAALPGSHRRDWPAADSDSRPGPAL